MKSKILSLMSVSIFALVLCMSLASAAVDYTNVTGNSQTVEAGDLVTITFQLEEDGYGNFTNMSFNDPITLTHGSESFNSSAITGMLDTSLNQSETSEVMTFTFDVPTGQEPGEYEGTLTLTGDYNNTMNYDLDVIITVEPSFDVCGEYNDLGNLDLRIDGIEVTKGFGEDEEIFPFDEVTVELEIENNGNEDIDDVVVRWALYDKETGDEIMDGKEDKFKIKDGDEESMTFEFILDDNIEDLEDGKDYVFYVWATGEDDEFDGNKTCIHDSEEVEIIIESDFAILYDIEYLETVACGSELQVSADVWNVGEEDQDEISVRVYNKDLGIDEQVEAGDIDALEKEGISFLLKIPEDAEEKYHTLTFFVYDEDGDLYENDFDDDKSEFRLPLKIEGSCSVESTTSAAVSASITSGGEAGKELVVTSTITNIGDESATYLVNAVGHADWAKLIKVEPSAITLESGESKEVAFTFEVSKDVSGDQIFQVEVISGTELVMEQPVSVLIEEAGLSLLPGFMEDAFSEGNGMLWGLGILNIVLVLSIILVAIKVAKKE